MVLRKNVRVLILRVAITVAVTVCYCVWAGHGIGHVGLINQQSVHQQLRLVRNNKKPSEIRIINRQA
jgi:hypothetical protein